jgi:hypothetical protein
MQANNVTLSLKNPKKRKNRKLIDRLLRLGYSLRLERNAEASRFDRR